MKFNNNEEAVSPVIGVILMVAITVILAAVIAVFVFGMADDIQSTHVVSITAKVSGDSITATFNGGAGADLLTNIQVIAYDDAGALDAINFPVVGNINSPGAGEFATGEYTWVAPTIGQRITIGDSTTIVPDGYRFVFIGSFTDGSEQVILDKQF